MYFVWFTMQENIATMKILPTILQNTITCIRSAYSTFYATNYQLPTTTSYCLFPAKCLLADTTSLLLPLTTYYILYGIPPVGCHRLFADTAYLLVLLTCRYRLLAGITCFLIQLACCPTYLLLHCTCCECKKNCLQGTT